MSEFTNKIKDFKELLAFGAMCVLAFIWMESQYVNASELKQYIQQDIEFQVYYLEQKKLRLEAEGKKLPLEDEALLRKLKSQGK